MGLSKKLAPVALSFSIVAGSAAAQETPQVANAPEAANDTELSFSCDQVARGDTLQEKMASVDPSVVYIKNKQGPPPSMPLGIEPETDIKIKPIPPSSRGDSTGSGVIIDAEQGYIVTNAHVLGHNVEGTEGRAFTVTFHDKNKRGYLGKEYNARLVGIDDSAKIDIAVLQIEGLEESVSLTCSQFADSDQVQVLDQAVAKGNPFGLTFTTTIGIVSHTRQEMPMRPGAPIPQHEYIQTDASVNRGNSGGPLYSAEGKVMGINTLILSPSGENNGIAFAIPSNVAVPAIDTLITRGEIKRGRLGAQVGEITEQHVLDNNLQSTEGAVITEVLPGSPAEAGGLKDGDIVLGVNGEKVLDTLELIRAIQNTWPGTDAHLEIIRDGERIELAVEVGELNPPPKVEGEKKPKGGVIPPPEEFLDEDEGGDAPEGNAPEDEGTPQGDDATPKDSQDPAASPTLPADPPPIPGHD